MASRCSHFLAMVLAVTGSKALLRPDTIWLHCHIIGQQFLQPAICCV